MTTSEKVSEIDQQIAELEHQVIFLKNVDIIQNNIAELSTKMNVGIEFTVDKIIQEIHFTSIISDLELNYLNKHILLSNSSLEQHFLIKLTHLNVYEFSLAYNKKIKTLKSIVPNSDEYFKALNYINKHIARIKAKHSFDKKIVFIRNKMAAHKELELNGYFNKIDLLNDSDCLKLIDNFKNFHNLLLKFTALVQECHYSGIPEDFDVENVFRVLAN